VAPRLTPASSSGWCEEDRERNRESEVKLGFFHGAGLLIGHREAAAFIGSVGGAAVDRAPGSAPPSCFLPEEEDGEEVSGPGSRGLDGWAAVW
jgi:hypothetical protein